MISIRQLLSWHADARENRLRPSAVGGVEIPPPGKLTEFACHYCPETFAEPEPCLHHMWTAHAVDRRKTERRSAAA